MSEYYQKIDRLREKYTKPKDIKKLERTEKALRKAIFNQGLADHDVIKEIIKTAQRDIEYINLLLANDQKLNKKEMEFERKILFAKRDWIKHDILNRFGFFNDKSVQETIEKSIDEIEKRTEKYEKLN